MVAVLAVLGVRSYLITPQSIFPTMSFSRIDVVAEAGDLPPDQVRVAVARPLEQAFQALPSVLKVSTTATQGSAEVVVEFNPKTDPRVDLQYVNAAISQIRASLTAANNIIAVTINPNSEPVLSYALTSKVLSQAVLRQIAEFQIVPQLYGVTGLGRILVTGGPIAEFHVTLDPASLAAQGIGASDVTKALANANNVTAVGNTQQFYQRYAIVLDAALHDVASLSHVMIPASNGTSVPLSALGTIAQGVSPITNQSSIDGTHAVIVNAYALAGADQVKMATEFRGRLDRVTAKLPSDVKVGNFWDQTTLIVESQKALRDAIVIGALLAIVVIYLFLRDFRLTAVAAAVIPIAMAIAIFALEQTGQTLNLMSVGGLAVAVGLIIDDAIVVIENISRNMREHPERSKSETISLSMTQLASAMIASTASTVVVFLPLALLTGVTGYFFRALAFTLSAALIVSLGLALFVAPILARVLLGEGPQPEHKRDWIAGILARYEPLLRWTLRRRAIVFIASGVTLVLTVVLLISLPSGFLPAMDEGQFEIRYAMPVGTTLAASDVTATMMEKIIKGDPAVVSVGRLTGIDSNGYAPTQVSQGLLRILVLPQSQRAAYEVVSDRLRDRISTAIPAATLDFHQILEDLINDLSGSPAPVEIAIHGTDQPTLIRLASEVASKIAKIPGVVDVKNGIVYNGPSLRISPRGNALARLGLLPSDLGDAVSSIAQGSIATSVTGAQNLIPVRVQIASQAARANALGAQAVYAKGSTTALGDLARLQAVRLSSDLTSINAQSLVRVTANISGANLSTVTADINKALAKIAFPPGYTTSIGGQAATQKQSFAEFLTVIAIAVALVFSVMLATFRSFRLPLVILTAIPLALIGVALGLVLTQTPFNVSSFMGLLLLVGVVVKNGILLIDVANKRREAGDDVTTSLVAAGKTRLRPIVMTTLAAIGGLFPLALGIGQGAEMEKPLAIAVIGGLSTATIFTLIVIPVLYAAFMGSGKRKTARIQEAA